MEVEASVYLARLPDSSPVPEPGTMVLLATGILCIIRVPAGKCPGAAGGGTVSEQVAGYARTLGVVSGLNAIASSARPRRFWRSQ